MQQSDHSLIRKQALTLATITVFGVAAILLGLALIILKHYHERAYVLLGLGAGGFIGGIAGPLLGTGAVCLIGGIACGIFAQSRTRTTSR